MSEDTLIYNSSEWKSLSFSTVEYPKGKIYWLLLQTHHQSLLDFVWFADDAFGKFLALLALSPLWVGSVFMGLILRCRDLHTVSTFKYWLVRQTLHLQSRCACTLCITIASIHRVPFLMTLSDCIFHRHATQRRLKHDTEVHDTRAQTGGSNKLLRWIRYAIVAQPVHVLFLGIHNTLSAQEVITTTT